MKLREKICLDAGTGLVARPEAIAEGLDDVIRGHAYVPGAPVDHSEHGCNDPAHGGHFHTVGVQR